MFVELIMNLVAFRCLLETNTSYGTYPGNIQNTNQLNEYLVLCSPPRLHLKLPYCSSQQGWWTRAAPPHCASQPLGQHTK